MNLDLQDITGNAYNRPNGRLMNEYIVTCRSYEDLENLV